MNMIFVIQIILTEGCFVTTLPPKIFSEIYQITYHNWLAFYFIWNIFLICLAQIIVPYLLYWYLTLYTLII